MKTFKVWLSERADAVTVQADWVDVNNNRLEFYTETPFPEAGTVSGRTTAIFNQWFYFKEVINGNY
jgi:hypothetical protein